MLYNNVMGTLQECDMITRANGNTNNNLHGTLLECVWWDYTCEILRNSFEELVKCSETPPWTQSPFTNMNQLSLSMDKQSQCQVMYGMKLPIHSQTSTIAPLKFGNGYIISSHILWWIWLSIRNETAGKRPVSKEIHDPDEKSRWLNNHWSFKYNEEARVQNSE